MSIGHIFFCINNLIDMAVSFIYIDLLSELARREKEAGIFPEAEVDLFMKVIKINIFRFFS
jgi:hypothetical protein